MYFVYHVTFWSFCKHTGTLQGNLKDLIKLLQQTFEKVDNVPRWINEHSTGNWTKKKKRKKNWNDWKSFDLRLPYELYHLIREKCIIFVWGSIISLKLVSMILQHVLHETIALLGVVIELIVSQQDVECLMYLRVGAMLWNMPIRILHMK